MGRLLYFQSFRSPSFGTQFSNDYLTERYWAMRRMRRSVLSAMVTRDFKNGKDHRIIDQEAVARNPGNETCPLRLCLQPAIDEHLYCTAG